MRKQRRWGTALGGLLAPVAAVLVLLCFLSALSHLESGQDQQGRQQLEEAIRRAAVACYAAEGIYPPDLDYLESRYGIQIDESRYAVSYEIFASNLMPDITVLENES
jgi:hypothetical protein